MKKLMIVMAFALVLCTVLVSAEEVFQQNQDIDLKVFVTNAKGGPVASNVECNTTVLDSDNNILINNVPMSYNNGSFFNITLEDTLDLGDYNGFAFCSNDVSSGSTPYDFTITATGSILDTSGSVISLIGVGSMALFALLFLILAGAFTHTGTRIFFLGLCLTTMVFMVGYISNMMRDTVGSFVAFTSTFATFYSLLTILLIGASLALVLWLIVFAFTAFRNTRGYND